MPGGFDNKDSTGTGLTADETLFVQTAAAGVLLLDETTAPSATAGIGKVYVKSSDSKIYFKDDSGTEYDLTAGASGANTSLSNLSAVAINTDLVLGASDGGALGSATKMWSDLFLASGAVINFNNGDVTLTHSADTLTLGGGTLALGTNSLTMTGSIGATGARVTKVWTTDLEISNLPSVGGTALTTTIAKLNLLTSAAGTTGTTSTNIVFSTSPVLTTPNIGAATATSVNGLTITSSTGVLTITNGKTLTTLKTMSFTAADDTGVYTLPTGTKTLLATDGAGTSLTGIPYTLTGTANQVVLSAGTGNITFSLPQSIATSSTPQFAKIGIGAAADASRLLLVTGDVAGGVATLERSNASTNGQIGTAIIKGTSTGDMADGFGPAFQFAIQDTAAVENLVGYISTIRDGADTKSKMVFGVANTGATAAVMQLVPTSLAPSANDGLALGTTALMWSDLFLASGAVVNFNNGDVTLTHSSDLLTIAGGNLSIGTSGVFTAGTIELGAASDTTLSRVSAGVIAVEGVTILTVAGGTLTGSIILGENTSIQHDPALSADGKYTGETITGTAGTTLAFGDLIYIDPTDSRWELADANAAAAADGDSRGVLGICVLAAAADGDPTTILLRGFVRADTAFPTFTVNNPVYISETAGDVTGTQPTTTDAVIRIIGSGFTGDVLYFNPENDWITHT